VNSLEKKYNRLGINLLLAEHKDYIDLLLLEIPEGKRNQGYGTRAMVDLCKFADKQKKKLTLTASTCYGSNLKRLKRFYGLFGFRTHGKIMIRIRFPRGAK
jgi:hypothetical protein